MKHTFKKLVFTAVLGAASLAAFAVADPATLGGTISPSPALWPTITPQQYQAFSFQFNNNGTATNNASVQILISLSGLDFDEPFSPATHISQMGTTPFTWTYDDINKIVIGTLAGNFAQLSGNVITINKLVVQLGSPQPANNIGAHVNVTAPGTFNSSTNNDDTESYTFTSSTIRGSVFNDTDGSAARNGGETVISDGSVWANLVDANDDVVSSVAVDAFGNYAFNIITPNTAYKIILTTTDQTGNTNLLLSDLPGTFAHTGVSNEGTPNTANQTGIINVNSGVNVNFLAQSFGIERPPTVDPLSAIYSDIVENTKYALSPNAVDPQSALAGNDPEQGALGTGATFLITNLPAGAKLYYNNVLITQTDVTNGNGSALITNYNPDLLEFSVDNVNSLNIAFSFRSIDAAGKASADAEYSITVLSILPVTGLSLNAHVANNKPVLQWVTLTEQNTRNFEIERSYDGTSYIKIGSMAAAGISNTKLNYTLVDNGAHSAKTIYYRVRLMDKNGKTVVSNIATVSIGSALVSIYPSPATSQVFVNGAGAGSQLVVMGVDGKVVKQATANGSGLDRLNVSSLASGTYLIQITTADGSTAVLRFIKTE